MLVIYELVQLPYDMYCPSVQKKIKDSRYQCQLPTCLKIFTTLDLAKRHYMLSGHTELSIAIQSEEAQTSNEDSDFDQAPVVSATEFLKLSFYFG